MPSQAVLFVFSFFAVIIAVLFVLYLFMLKGKKRTQAMRRLAALKGFGFQAEGDDSILSDLPGLHLFSRGHSKKIRNILHRETNNIDEKIFDYKYTVGSGKNSSTYKQTVICFRSNELNLPDFSLRPEHIFHKIGSAFGYKDIDFDTNPRFSKQYLLRGDDEEAIRGVFKPVVLSFYEKQKGLCTEGSKNQLIFYRSNRRVKPEEINSFSEQGMRVFEIFKS